MVLALGASGSALVGCSPAPAAPELDVVAGLGCATTVSSGEPAPPSGGPDGEDPGAAVTAWLGDAVRPDDEMRWAQAQVDGGPPPATVEVLVVRDDEVVAEVTTAATEDGWRVEESRTCADSPVP